MTVRLFKVFSIETFQCNFQQVRYGHRMLGKPPTAARNLKQRLEELNQKDPSISFEVNIGFNESKLSKQELLQKWINDMKEVRKSSVAEKKARNKDLIIDLTKVQKDWEVTTAPTDLEQVARHYSIFKDLFGDAYFKPVVPLHVTYNFENMNVNVYQGNILKPSEASTRPDISYESDPKALWSLLMTTPDNHFTHPDNEYCHWFIGNIPGNNLEKGEQLIDYLQPFPPCGSGYGRYIFLLYKQTKPIDYSEYKKTQPCLNLNDRNWKTLDFYRKYQNDITPAGLAFFQASWENSLIDFYHNTLDMPHPTFEYDFPKPYIKPQTWFPIREAFNRYLDRYRDQKEIHKELVLKKLKKSHPFKVLEPTLKYPAAQRLDDHNLPTWYRVQLKKERVGGGWINSIK